ncbi:maltose O-acetyltransferase [Hyella patelloides LEGE 07179]|uniref:Acetyltransferase n=1 Tax=Hyella patelloides LEGE 07179 TaxID=945734 RepID=A0A563VQR6_9CYAN|nr:sugar O-acetyltransferase [Hyella patelloides]VEP13715.1 maltose O-acetyltransferase [Hyella patelloides LEGE 07179]
MQEKTEKEKMLNSELYLATDEELTRMHFVARQLLYSFNFSQPDEVDRQQHIIHSLFGKIGSNFSIKPPFYCDYGCHIFAGNNLYINFDCTIIDCNKVHLGNNVLLAPKVQIYTAYHPTNPNLRLSGKELAAPVTIGDNVWLGGGVIVCPGVSIGSNVTIGAGSVVTQDIPHNVVAVGNPCRVIKSV